MVEHKIRKATPEDLETLDSLVKAHKKELGFVRRVTLAESISARSLLVTEIDNKVIGLVHYRHRRDAQTTLYDIVVESNYRFMGVGKTLIDALIAEAQTLGKQTIVLKCPEELPANDFYAHLDFERLREEPGKHRRLIVWQFFIPSG